MTADLPVSKLWVVLPAHNEQLTLPATLSALKAQKDCDFTLVIVDNASKDSTGVIAQQFALDAPFPVVVLYEAEKGVGSAVDTAARHAIANGATWIARTDSDSLPASDWTAVVKRVLADGTELAIGRMLARRDENSLPVRAAFAAAVGAAILFGRIRTKHRSVDAPPYRMHAGFNMALTADLYERCGGMPRRPSPTDRIFMNRVRTAGARIERHADMRVETSLRRFRTLGVVGTARWYLDRGAKIEDPR